MARKYTVKWSDADQAYVQYVRFPGNKRRKAKAVDIDKAQDKYDALIEERDREGKPPEKRTKLITWDELVTAWIAAGCPNSIARHETDRNINTSSNAEGMLRTDVAPRRDLDPDPESIPKKNRRRRQPNPKAVTTVTVERTSTARLQEIFKQMDAEGLSTATIVETFRYLRQCAEWGVRQELIKAHNVERVQLPKKKKPAERKALTYDQARRFFVMIPHHRLFALWFTAVMVGLRPGEILGLRWNYVDLDSDEPNLSIIEAAKYDDRDVYIGQGEPKTGREYRIGLHPLAVAALRKHRENMIALGRYEVDNTLYAERGFVFPTKNRLPMNRSSCRRYLREVTDAAGIGTEWKTYELRHTFGTLARKMVAKKTVALVMGHSKESTGDIYDHNTAADLPVMNDAINVWSFLESTSADKVLEIEKKVS